MVRRNGALSEKTERRRGPSCEHRCSGLGDDAERQGCLDFASGGDLASLAGSGVSVDEGVCTCIARVDVTCVGDGDTDRRDESSAG